ncbi:MAG: universal stress protein [Candidatus Nitrosocosmicus sp.]|nr:universal stress protein [Candidatus Nitrosocosmicus sp.]
MKILALVDGSDNSIKSLEHMVNLLNQIDPKKATKTDGNKSDHEVIILSVLVPFHITNIVEKNIQSGNSVKGEKLKAYLKEINAEVEKEWIAKPAELKSKYQQEGIIVKTKLLEGSHSSNFVAYSIVKFAEDENIDLISVGKIGTGGSHSNKLLGSVARNIAEISTRPLLIVP